MTIGRGFIPGVEGGVLSLKEAYIGCIMKGKKLRRGELAHEFLEREKMDSHGTGMLRVGERRETSLHSQEMHINQPEELQTDLNVISNHGSIVINGNDN